MLEKNVRNSSSKRSHNINISFFVDDRVKAGEVSIITYDMVGDYFTKPLQFTKFINFRDNILNVQDG